MPAVSLLETRLLCLGETARSALLISAFKHLPEESCGILIGRLDGLQASVVKVVQTENISDDRRNSFQISSDAMYRSSAAGRAAGLDLIGFYHSHPVGPATPSSKDVAQASGWPGTLNIIIGIWDQPMIRAWRTNRSFWSEIEIVSGN